MKMIPDSVILAAITAAAWILSVYLDKEGENGTDID